MTPYDDPTSPQPAGDDDDADLGIEAALVDAALGELEDAQGATESVPGENPYDGVVALITATLTPPAAVRPELSRQLAAAAGRYVRPATVAAAPTEPAGMRIDPAIAAARHRQPSPAVLPPADRSSPLLAWTGWVAAAAACVALVMALNREPSADPAPPPGPTVQLPPTPTPTPTPAPEPSQPQVALTPAEERARLLAAGGDAVVQAQWEPPAPDATPVRGDVVWSDREQRGFLRFADLAPNNPEEWVYQLWIFDAERDDRFPVDGGVFSVAATTAGAGGEVIIPIDPKLKVHKGAMFAITREKPGGAVVSDRSQMVALAKAS